jgi:hypothetical protein
MELPASDRSRLEEAARLVNEANRFAMPALVRVITCSICGVPFAEPVTHGYRLRYVTRVCPGIACRDEATRRRRRGRTRQPPAGEAPPSESP